MKVWKRVTQTLGDIWAPCLMGVLLGTTGVLFMKLPISSTNDATLEENIFGKKGNQKGVSAESLQRVTGSGIMGHVQNSRTTSKNSVRRILVEPYSPSMGHLEGSTMKKHDNSFFMTF